MSIARKLALLIGGLVVMLFVAVLAVGFLVVQPRGDLGAARARETEGRPPAEEAAALREVETVQARRDSSFQQTVKEIAEVEAYYPVRLVSRVPGYVKEIHRTLNDEVAEGEVLVELDVPDLQTTVLARQAALDKAQKDVDLAREKLGVLKAAEDVATAQVALRGTDVTIAEATRDFRYTRWNRFKNLNSEEGVNKTVVDEEERNYKIAEAGVKGANAAVRKANADLEEAHANYRAGNADITVKQALVEVARQDRQAAQVELDYAKIRAPFDGVIVERQVNPSDFVPRPESANPKALLTVARVDIVTVVMKVPETYAHFIARDTQAAIEMGDLVLEGKVTRFAPSLDDRDRTRRVEVDIYNGTNREEYDRWVEKVRPTWNQVRKGKEDPMPPFPHVAGQVPEGRPHPLLPGDQGNMTLVLRKFDNQFLLPEETVFTHGGKSFVAEVKDGKVHLLPVEVQLHYDGRVKVALVERLTSPGGIPHEVRTDLTGQRAIVRSGGGELSDGQEVKARPVAW